MTGIVYSHRQTSRLLTWVSMVTLVLTFGVLVLQGAPGGAILVSLGILGAILIPVTAVFSSLLVEIGQGELRVRFGLGLQVKRVALRDVEQASVVTTPWWYGYGIRITPYGMVYNVSGRGGVEIRMRDGKAFRLGTDEPEQLAMAIKAARAGS